MTRLDGGAEAGEPQCDRSAHVGRGSTYCVGSTRPSQAVPFYLPLDDQLVPRAATALTVFIEQAFQRSPDYPKLTPFDFAVLRFVAQFDGTGVATPDVGRAFKLSAATAVTLLQRLVDLDLVTLEPPAGRKRPAHARLNDKGWQALANDPYHGALIDLFSNLQHDGCRELFEGIIRTEHAQDRWRALNLSVDFWR
jgi:DNA-binding MarR family transcriptional regulator